MLIRLSYVFIVLTLAIVAFLFIRFSGKEASESATVVGVDRCRSCHEAASAGAQVAVWQRSAHADAYHALLSDSVQNYLKAHNISIEQCLGCHTTLGRKAFNEVERAVNSNGVGCERCHGPGSRYAFYDMMTDRQAFLASGGVVGTLQDCYQCHARNPATAETHCPFQLRPFVADSAWKSIAHPVPEIPKQDTVLDLRNQ